jgi:hypothetical protein
MKERGLGYKGLADVLGISEYAAYRRLRGFTAWKLPETIFLSEYFSVSDIAWLFQCDCE